MVTFMLSSKFYAQFNSTFQYLKTGQGDECDGFFVVILLFVCFYDIS